MSCQSTDRWRDAQGRHIPVGSRVEQVGLGARWGARRSRLFQRGVVLGRRRARLLVRFDGELGWVSLRPCLVRMLADEAATPLPGIQRVTAVLEELRTRS